MAPPSAQTMKELLDGAWQLVQREQPSLFVYARDGASLERALCFRLGHHLWTMIDAHREQWVAPWSEVVVDSELHRASAGMKIEGIKAPDLVVHVRGNDNANLLVLEAKHGRDADDRDRDKLRILARPPRAYQCAWAIRLDESRAPTIVFDTAGVMANANHRRTDR